MNDDGVLAIVESDNGVMLMVRSISGGGEIQLKCIDGQEWQCGRNNGRISLSRSPPLLGHHRH